MEPQVERDPGDVQPPGGIHLVRVIRVFEHLTVLFLMGLLMVVVSICSLELAWLVIQGLRRTTDLVLDVEEAFELFGFFLLVLIGLELLATLKAYLFDRVFHVEVVLEVALVAIAQKIIILDTSRASGPTMLGLAGLVLALAAAFWLIAMARRARVRPERV